MKMKHVMTAMLLGVFAVGAAQAQKMQNKYYPITPEVYGRTAIIYAKNTNQTNQMGLQSFTQSWTKPILQTGDGKYKAPSNTHMGNGRLNHGISHVFNTRSAAYISGLERTGNPYKILAWGAVLEGGKFLWPDKDVCVVKEVRNAGTAKISDPCMIKNIDLNDDGSRAYGGVVCVDGKPSKICVWEKNISQYAKDITAFKIISQCIKKHEEFHMKVHNNGKELGIKNYEMICKQMDKSEGVRASYESEDIMNKKECDPYLIELDCLNKARLTDKACTSTCQDQISDRIKNGIMRYANAMGVCEAGYNNGAELLCGELYYFNKKTNTGGAYTNADFLTKFACKK